MRRARALASPPWPTDLTKSSSLARLRALLFLPEQSHARHSVCVLGPGLATGAFFFRTAARRPFSPPGSRPAAERAWQKTSSSLPIGRHLETMQGRRARFLWPPIYLRHIGTLRGHRRLCRTTSWVASQRSPARECRLEVMTASLDGGLSLARVIDSYSFVTPRPIEAARVY
jgi:hypothetical protein